MKALRAGLRHLGKLCHTMCDVEGDEGSQDVKGERHRSKSLQGLGRTSSESLWPGEVGAQANARGCCDGCVCQAIERDTILTKPFASKSNEKEPSHHLTQLITSVGPWALEIEKQARWLRVILCGVIMLSHYVVGGCSTSSGICVFPEA